MSAAAILFSFGAAFCWAVAPLIYRRNLAGLSLYDLNAVRSIGFTGGMIVLVLVFNPDVLFRIPSPTVIAGSATIALLANLIGPLNSTRTKVELRNKSLQSATILEEAGVEFSIMTDAPVERVGLLFDDVRLAVRSGLSQETALKAITMTTIASRTLRSGSLRRRSSSGGTSIRSP